MHIKEPNVENIYLKIINKMVQSIYYGSTIIKSPLIEIPIFFLL